jgi:hypothetical protein
MSVQVNYKDGKPYVLVSKCCGEQNLGKLLCLEGPQEEWMMMYVCMKCGRPCETVEVRKPAVSDVVEQSAGWTVSKAIFDKAVKSVVL